MFQRGQKIIITESSADKKAHPRTGDVGYLDNMYLFINDKFILLDAFFFQYGTNSEHNKDRIEKKRFIIDLGMKNGFKLSINKDVPLKFFVDRCHVNLTSTGYITKVLDGIEALIEYPLMHSNYGIWNSARKSKKGRSVEVHISKEKYKIPYGQIALFSSKCNSKYKIEERSDNEFIAWMRSMMPVVSSMLNVFYNYKLGIKLFRDKTVDDCFTMSSAQSKLLKSYVKCLYTNVRNIEYGESKYMSSGYQILEDIKKLDKSKKAVIIRDINFINSLNNIFIQRLDKYYINTFNHGEYDQIRDYIRHMWNTHGVLYEENIQIKEIKPVVDIVKSIICRTMMTRSDAKEKINLVLNYLPTAWHIPFKNKISDINKMKLEADNNSSALNRIYEIV